MLGHDPQNKQVLPPSSRGETRGNSDNLEYEAERQTIEAKIFLGPLSNAFRKERYISLSIPWRTRQGSWPMLPALAQVLGRCISDGGNKGTCQMLCLNPQYNG